MANVWSFADHSPYAPRSGNPDDRDNEMNENNDKIAPHSRILSDEET